MRMIKEEEEEEKEKKVKEKERWEEENEEEAEYIGLLGCLVGVELRFKLSFRETVRD